MKKLLALLVMVAMLLPSCQKINERIDGLEDRIDQIEGTQIATINQQIEAINVSLDALDAMDKELKGYIDGLQATADNLQEQINATNSKIDAVKAELQGEISTAKAEILAELEALETELRNELAQINATIEILQAKDSDFEKRIDELEKQVEQLAGMDGSTDWVNATFATLEQHNALASEVTTIKEQIKAINQSITDLETRLTTKINEDIASAVSTLNADIQQKVKDITDAYTNAVKTAKEEITSAYTEAIATAIANLESSMKQWVNEQLTGYYTIAETDAALEALQNSVDEDNKVLQEDIKELSEKVDDMKTELTQAYNTAIEEAINTNNGVIDGKIAEAVATVNSRIDSEVATINARIDALEERIEDLEDALDKIKSLDIVFDIESGKACMAGASIEFGYTIVGGDDDTEVESFGDGGWRADVMATDATSGRIRVTAPKDGGSGKVVVLATSGAGASAMKSIRFDEGILTDILDSYEVDWEACTLEVKLRTNINYEVRIPADAQSWLSVAETRAEVRAETLTFSISENPEDNPVRTAVVELVSEFGEVVQSFEIAQKQQPVSTPIEFADKNVKKVCVEKFDTNGDGELSRMEALKVKDIGGRFFGDYAMAVKSFDEFQYFVNVASIGSSAFSGCSSLTSITIPDGVTSIEYRAFENCSSLTSITIPENVVSIGVAAFEGCSSLEEFKGKFASNDGRCLIVEDKLIALAPAAGTTDYTIPYGVTSIESCAFRGCSSLTSITILESVVSIGDEAFALCSSLKDVYCKAITPPAGGSEMFYNNASGRKIYVPMESVDAYKAASGWSNYADYIFEEGEPKPANNEIWYTASEKTDPYFDDFTAFGSNAVSNVWDSETKRGVITFDGDVTMIGDDAFYKCSSLTSVTIPDSVTEIGKSAFYDCDSLTSVTIPDSVTSIGTYAFSSCDSLTSVTIPDSVTEIGNDAFHYCSSLTSVTIGDSVTTIGDWAFYDCNSLTSVTIPDSVTSIGTYAFSSCDSLTSVNIGDNVTKIGEKAFYQCSSLKKVYCYATIPPSLGSSAFSSNASGRRICVYEECVELYKSAWSSYKDSIYTNGKNCSDTITIEYTTNDGNTVTPSNLPIISNTYENGVGTLIVGKIARIPDSAFAYCSSLTSVTIPDSVTEIGSDAFRNCYSLTSVTIPDSVTEIGSYSFYYCKSLTSVTIPDSVTEIGSYAFYYCKSLTSVTIGDSVTEIGTEAFRDCDSLTSVTIPDSVTSIGKEAFSYCDSLTSVNIGDSVTSIGNSAFYDCGSLTSVTIGDSVTEIGYRAFANCDSLKSVYCKAITPPALGGSDVFDDNSSGRKIYVPTSSVNAYKSAGNWSYYASAIVGYDF